MAHPNLSVRAAGNGLSSHTMAARKNPPSLDMGSVKDMKQRKTASMLEYLPF